MVDRIKQIMELKGLTPAMLSELLDINRSSLTHLFSGRNQPSLELTRKILKTFPDVKTEWLIMGVGPMLQDEVRATINAQLAIEPDIIVPSSETETQSAPTADLFSAAETEPEFSPVPIVPPAPTNTQSEKPEPSTQPAPSSPQEPEPINQTVPTFELSQSKQSPKVDIASTTQNRERTASARQRNSEKNDSQSVKKLEKIVFFYSNQTFEVFYPEK